MRTGLHNMKQAHFSISIILQNTMADCYLPTPLLEEPMVFPPSRERLPSGNMWTQPPWFNFDMAKSIPYSRESRWNYNHHKPEKFQFGEAKGNKARDIGKERKISIQTDRGRYSQLKTLQKNKKHP